MQMDSKSQVQKISEAGLSDLIAPVNLQFLRAMKYPSLLLKIFEGVSTINTILIIINYINFLLISAVIFLI